MGMADDDCIREWDMTSQRYNIVFYSLGGIFAIWSFFKNY